MFSVCLLFFQCAIVAICDIYDFRMYLLLTLERPGVFLVSVFLLNYYAVGNKLSRVLVCCFLCRGDFQNQNRIKPF